MQTHNPTARHRQTREPDFHGAAIIDDQGREIPITEQMVQQACSKLDSAWPFAAPRRHRHSA